MSNPEKPNAGELVWAGQRGLATVGAANSLVSRGMANLAQIHSSKVIAPVSLNEIIEEFEYVFEWKTMKGKRRVRTMALGGGVNIELVRIPKGTFIMGSPIEEVSRVENITTHKVEISRDYYIGKYAVTQAQYLAIMDESPSYFKGKHLPVERVSWIDAMTFCNRIGKYIGTKSCYAKKSDDEWAWDTNAIGCRLPTEAEWEYACRAGTTTPYHFGSWISGEVANCDGDGTVDVGSYLPNQRGLYDMHGNVCEWCWDWYGNYSDVPAKLDPCQNVKQASDDRVLRGGTWFDCGLTDTSFYAAGRDYNAPSYHGGNGCGFRICITADTNLSIQEALL